MLHCRNSSNPKYDIYDFISKCLLQFSQAFIRIMSWKRFLKNLTTIRVRAARVLKNSVGNIYNERFDYWNGIEIYGTSLTKRRACVPFNFNKISDNLTLSTFASISTKTTKFYMNLDYPSISLLYKSERRSYYIRLNSVYYNTSTKCYTALAISMPNNKFPIIFKTF